MKTYTMYYKIENKKCEVYKKLYEMRKQEIELEKENADAIKQKVGLKFETYLGHQGQQNFRRVTQYEGFKFTEPEKVDLKIWQTDKEHKEIYVPNRKTKAGREMADFLLNGLKGSLYSKVLDILDVPHLRKFTFPYVDIAENDFIIIFLDDDQEPADKNVIEITKREFDQLRLMKKQAVLA